MVVASSRRLELRAHPGLLQGRSRPDRRDHRQRLEGRRDLGIDEAVVAVAATSLDRQEATVDQLRELDARRGSGDLCPPRQLARRK